MLLGAVADDFTGATDLAVALRRRGLRTAVAVGSSSLSSGALGDRTEGLDALVVALKSRTAPVAEAVATSTAALDALVASGAERLYLKYCSTFDSTDEGNIGPVLDAFLARLDVDRTVVVPSFPAAGRTVEGGLLSVHGELLEESPMRHHPLTPMTRSRVRDLLAPQTRSVVSEVLLPVVRAGAIALRDAVDAAPAGLVVVDAVDDADLRTIAAATGHLRLLSGAAGLAVGFGGQPDATVADATGPDDAFPTSGRRLVVCGSASSATRAQVAHAAERNRVWRVDVAAALADPAAEIATLAAWCRAQPDHVVPVVYSVGTLADVVPAAEGGARAAAAVEAVLAGLVAELVGDGSVGRVVVAGGETSGAVVTELGVDLLRIGPEVATGVCWSTATTATGREVALVLKSGNFGGPDFFSTAWEARA